MALGTSAAPSHEQSGIICCCCSRILTTSIGVKIKEVSTDPAPALNIRSFRVRLLLVLRSLISYYQHLVSFPTILYGFGSYDSCEVNWHKYEGSVPQFQRSDLPGNMQKWQNVSYSLIAILRSSRWRKITLRVFGWVPKVSYITDAKIPKGPYVSTIPESVDFVNMQKQR